MDMDMDMDMDPSTLHLHQEMGSLESMLVCTKKQQQQQQEAEAEQQKKPRPAEQALKCPRCDSTNTKFCYYNNYSLSQPRYFCKGCRRYWTKGGTLRNVPVGGGCRKNKRSSSSSSSKLIRSSSSNSTHLVSDHHHGSPLIIPSSSPYLGTPGHLGVIDHDHHHHAHGVSILGNPFDILGNPNSAPAAHHHLIQSLYNYEGFGSGNLGDVENVGGNSVYVSEDMAMQSYDHHHHHQHQDVKQESCGDENRPALWGFPWQLNGEMTNLGLGSGGNSEGEFYQVRESWNGLGGGWHGLLNSPLM